MPTDTTEKALETLICRAMTGGDCLGPARHGCPDEAGGTGWIASNPADFNRQYSVDLAQLRVFLDASQPETADALDLDPDGPVRRKFLSRLQGEISKRGVVDVLRVGIRHGPHHQIDLFYGTPTAGNVAAVERHELNRFSVARQLRYSLDETQLALDLCLFINGLPVATFELKNNLTTQTVADAEEQYKRDRDPRERLFEFGRCVVHFAVDDAAVRMCTHLKRQDSWFLPFDRGWNEGAGNPPNPEGLRTDYLWKHILTPAGLTDIIENYAQIIETKDPRTGKKKRQQIFPRFHQLDVIRKLLADAAKNGAGKRYLIQHSAGSGKSNSIAWLAHQLVGLRRSAPSPEATSDDGGTSWATTRVAHTPLGPDLDVNVGPRPQTLGPSVFDSIIVITDRRVLDRQINDTVKQFVQVRSTVGHAERSGELKELIKGGKKIIISTIQKFPVILDEIGTEHRGRTFAIIIDEAHSSQGGKAAKAVSGALGEAGVEEDNEDFEDAVNRVMESRKLLTNASYFAFTATPKNKTLQTFGDPYVVDGETKHRAFHSYTMKQAIEEGFILDVLKNYTPVNSYYRLIKTVDTDPEFDARRATKRLRRYVESNDHAIRTKSEIIVDHFQRQIVALNKVGGKARAMVVTDGVERAIQYFFAIRDYLEERKLPHRPIVAFSGEHEFRGHVVTEPSLNGFASNVIVERIQEDPYRFLVCADKFQTGYDEPLLHTMYVDKHLSGVRAVQTLSRLNRSEPGKYDTAVLDFMNDTEIIRRAFEPYYRTTILSEETDPNKLHDLKADLDGFGVYQPHQVQDFIALYLGRADRDQLDPILDACVGVYLADLDEDGQVAFKGSAKAFTRTYNFLAALLPYSNAEWEKLSTFLDFLIRKLPAPKEEDLSSGILDAIDMDSYRVEMEKALAIALPDTDVEIGPVPTETPGHVVEPEMNVLSNILKVFNDLFGNIEWTDRDRVQKLITEEIPAKVAADQAYQNAQRNSDKDNARIEHDKALQRVMTAVLKDDTELFKQFSDNDSFRKWLQDTIFSETYNAYAAPVQLHIDTGEHELPRAAEDHAALEPGGQPG